MEIANKLPTAKGRGQKNKKRRCYMKPEKKFFVLGAASCLVIIIPVVFVKEVPLKAYLACCCSALSSIFFWVVGRYGYEGQSVRKKFLCALEGRVWRVTNHNIEGKGENIQLVDIINPNKIVFVERGAVAPVVEGKGHSNLNNGRLVRVEKDTLQFLPE
jgi:hypothetical protein